MKSLRYISLLLVTLLISTSQLTAQQSDLLPDQFDRWVERGMQQWDIPGLAIAIVKDGEVIHANGYGVKKLGEAARVNTDTQFGIASVSKHMTALSLGILVDEGVISWNDPVQKHIPWFKLSDPYASELVTIRDLLTHQVGVGRMLGNRLQFMTDRSRDELLYRMRYHEFEQPFRSQYVYSNVMYTLAGEVVNAVTDLTWDEFMTERLFEPLGMDRTNTSIHDLDEENAAWPHQYIKGEVVTIPRRSWDIGAPAGGVNSTMTDMTQWMKMMLGTPGSLDDERLLTTRTMREIMTPQVSQPIGSVTSSMRGYGFGLSITDYQGVRVISHGGATDGMNTTYMLIPEEDFGIIITTNVFSNFREAIAYTVIDHILDVEGNDWNERYYDNYTSRYETVKQLREEFEATRIPDTSPTHDLEAYTGSFYDEQYDNAEVTLEDGTLKLTLWDDDSIRAELEHWHHNTFRVVWENPAQREEFVTFGMDLEGEIDEMTIRFTLRPMLLQVGAYPTNYYRDVSYERVAN
ncbi:MAG: serine hydrolase [Balneolaceae bacterium]|nr:serine hydrolase [Balneolaceae bacterium]MCH8548392.1 serine hydrolase [Balneolaceae bacterium]